MREGVKMGGRDGGTEEGKQRMGGGRDGGNK